MLLREEFIYSTSENWYWFNGNRWMKMGSHSKLSEKLEEMAKIYEKKGEMLGRLLKENEEVFTEDGGDKKKMKDLLKRCGEMYYCLMNRKDRVEIIKDLCEVLEYKDEVHDTLEEILDTKELLCFSNGVLDMTGDEIVFRKGEREDYCSLTTGYDYKKLGEIDNEVIEQVHKFIGEICPIEESREWILNVMTKMLEVGNKEEYFHIWNGGGSNGKSVLTKLLLKAFGKYGEVIDSGIITEKKRSVESATPTFMELIGKRVVILEELDEGAKANMGTIKKLTTDDYLIKARKLNKGLCNFNVSFKLILNCNVLPDIKECNKGAWRRLCISDFPSTFYINNNEFEVSKSEHKFMADVYIKKNLDKWKSALMAILVERFRGLKGNSLEKSQMVEIGTGFYRDNEDNFIDFVRECITETDDKYDEIAVSLMYEYYKDFMAGKIDNKHLPRPKELTQYIDNKFRKKEILITQENKNRTGWIKLKYILPKITIDEE